MTQDERRLYLIQALIKEDDGAGAQWLGLTPGNGGGFVIPYGKEDQQNILRALMNIREPFAASEEFLKIQDEYLKQRNAERGVTDINTLKPVSSDSRLYLWQGDITTLNADAIVNAANSRLLGCFAPLHACIDNCIHTFSGIQLRLACSELMNAQGHEEGTGLCKITPAFNLPSKFVLHTVGPIISLYVSEKEKLLLASCYKSCLETASKNSLETVAFCCISTGVFHFSAELACKIAVSTVKDWLNEHPASTVKKVIFNVFSDKDREIYEKKLK